MNSFILVMALMAPTQADGGLPRPSSPALVIEERQHIYNINQALEIFRDEKHEEDFHSITAPAKADPFSKPERIFMGTGYTRAAIWARAKLEVGEQAAGRWLLEIPYAPLDDVRLWVSRPGREPIAYATGDGQPFDARPIPHHTYLFPLNLAQGEKITLLIRAATSSAFVLPVSLIESSHHVQRDRNVQLVYGIIYGALLLAVLYYLVLYFVLRDQSYLAFVFMVGGLGMNAAAVVGHPFQFLWPESVGWANTVNIFSGSLGMFGGAWFTRSFLRTPIMAPRTDKLLQLLLWAGAIFAVGSFIVPYRYVSQGLTFGALLSVLVATTASVGAIRRGYAPARYYLAGWTVFLVSLVMLGLRNNGILQVDLVSLYGPLLGLVSLAVFVAVALSSRIKENEEKRRHAQEDALDQVPAIMFVVQAAGEMRFANQAARRFFNIPKNLENTPARKVLEASSKDLNEALQKTLAGKTGESRGECTVLHGEGEERRVEYVFTASLDAWGALETVTAHLVDATETRAHEAYLEQRSEEINRAVASLAAGDLSIALPSDGDDAMSRICQELMAMAKGLRALVGEIRASNTRILFFSEGLAEAAGRIAQGARSQRGLTESSLTQVMQLRGGLDEVLLEARELSTASAANMESLSSMDDVVRRAAQEIGRIRQEGTHSAAAVDSLLEEIEAVAVMTDQATGLAATTDGAARKGLESAQRTEEGMRAIREEMASVEQGVARIDEARGAISSFADLIHSISGQSRLLSLNASIVAARAGAAGRPFVVVAEEIRRLAENSRSAAAEVTQTVDSLTRITTNAIDLVKHAVLRADEGLHLAADTRDNLSSILVAAEETRRLMDSASETTRSQNAQIERVKIAMAQVNALTVKVGRASDEQSSEIQRVSERGQEMARRADAVQNHTEEQGKQAQHVENASTEVEKVVRDHLQEVGALGQLSRDLTEESSQVMDAVRRFRLN